jgi:hypothetical protein
LSKPPRNTAEAGIVTAGSGTGLVVLANSLPPGTLHDLAVYAAPAASVAIGTAVFLLRARAQRAIKRRLLTELRAASLQLLEDPHRSHEDKQAIAAKIQALELELLDQDIEQIRLL